MSKKYTITLTQRQAHSLMQCCADAAQLLQEFLRHEEWDCDMTKREKEKHLRIDRFYEKTYEMLLSKIRGE